MSGHDQSENVSGDGENANVLQNPEADQQVAQQQQPVPPSNTTPRQPMIMSQYQGTTYFYTANSATPAQLVQHGDGPNVQLNVQPPQNVAFSSQHYAQPGQVMNPQHAREATEPLSNTRSWSPVVVSQFQYRGTTYFVPASSMPSLNLDSNRPEHSKYGQSVQEYNPLFPMPQNYAPQEDVEKYFPSKATLKPEKSPLDKTPDQWNPLPEHLLAALDKSLSPVSSSTDEERDPYADVITPAPSDFDWSLDSNDERLILKTDDEDGDVETIPIMTSTPEPSDFRWSLDSKNETLKLETDDDDDEVEVNNAADNAGEPSFYMALDILSTKNQLTQSCKHYIEAHLAVRQILLKTKAVCIDHVETDNIQKWLVECSTIKPEPFWEETHTTIARDCINKLKNSHRHNTTQDMVLRLKCEILLENMHLVIAQDIQSLESTSRHGGLLEELECKYLKIVFNSSEGRPKIVTYLDKLSPQYKAILRFSEWTVETRNEQLKAYIKRQTTVHSIGRQRKIAYANVTDEYLTEMYFANKISFDQQLAENRDELVANFLKFWRWHQTILTEVLPRMQDERFPFWLRFIEVLLSFPLEDPEANVLIFDAQALETLYFEYYSIVDPFTLTEHTTRYFLLVFELLPKAQTRDAHE